ncbi:19732_t:CDS:1 [Dentiscutata erythropus]|uniref:19732_t:CDS:1 n=1 Tax=Dentiscutata erythropus TaxID=1348616 RepID=A0A9N9IBF8_9GLOM|nr:19732_t:CDS:1 [Dentiscutata erythropus]
MVEHPCTKCGKSFSKLWKFRRHNKRQYKCRPKVIPQITILQVKDQDIPPTVTHIRGRDRRREITKRNKSPILIFQEAGPGPATQAYRKNIASQNKLQEAIKDGDVELKQSDIQPDLIKEKYLRADKNAPKGNIRFEKNLLIHQGLIKILHY